MVDKKILREMSQDVLVIPFTEEMADKLDKFCRIQIENIEQNKVEKLIMSFLTRKNDKELEMAFNKYATESEQTNNITCCHIACTCRVYRIAGYRRMRRNKEKSLIYTYVEECPSDSGER